MKHGGRTTERKEAIRGAYRMTGGNSFYDGMITCSTLSGKAVCRLVWAMNKAECDAYLEKALSGVPDDFSGKLLEVPVGSGHHLSGLLPGHDGSGTGKGRFFTPPYETVDSLKVQLEEMYDAVEIGNVKGIAWFVCRKGENL